MPQPLTALQLEATGPATLAEVMEEVEFQAQNGKAERLRPIPTGFTPLDDILNGGLRSGELMMVGGTFGVGKTIWALPGGPQCRGERHDRPRAVHLL